MTFDTNQLSAKCKWQSLTSAPFEKSCYGTCQWVCRRRKKRESKGGDEDWLINQIVKLLHVISWLVWYNFECCIFMFLSWHFTGAWPCYRIRPCLFFFCLYREYIATETGFSFYQKKLNTLRMALIYWVTFKTKQIRVLCKNVGAPVREYGKLFLLIGLKAVNKHFIF